MGAAQVEPKRERAFARSRALAAEVEGILEGAEMTRKRHSDVEDFLEAKGREWARRMYEEHLGLRSQLERPTAVVGADGTPRTSTRDSERQLQTVLGRVGVPRRAYQAPGTEDLHPMDAALNLPREMSRTASAGWWPRRRRAPRSMRSWRSWATTPARRSPSGRSRSWPCGRRRTSTPSTSRRPRPARPRTTCWSSARTARAS